MRSLPPEELPGPSPRQLTVLVVDDNPVDRETVARALPAFDILHASTAAEARELCRTTSPDCVLLDCHLPDADGIDLLPFFGRRNLPVVVFTGHDSGDLAALAIRRGAQDYLTKDRLHPELLETTLLRAVQRHHADAQFRIALEAAPGGMILCDDGGRIQLVNAAAERIFGYERGELVGRPIEVLIPERDRERHVEQRRAFAQAPTPRPMSTRPVLVGKRSNGDRIPVEISLSPIQALKSTFILCSVVDLSKQRDLERQVQGAQRMEAVGRLAAGVAHDFNNLLTVIQTYAAFIQGEFREGDPIYEDAVAIREASVRAASLTRQLLAFSRQQVLETRVLPINDIVRELEGMLRRLIGEDIEVVTSLGPDTNLVKVDPSQLDQVLINLAVNARDAMPEGGTLTLETSSVEIDARFGAERRVEVPPGRYASLRVTDTGTGMDGPTLDRVFEPFFSTKDRHRGTGLGMSTVYGIVKQSGGYIWIESALGEGTRVDIQLPLAEGPPSERAPKLARALPRGSAVVLLVEDEEMVRRATARILDRQGYRVLNASCAEDALHIVGDETGIDLLLTDIVLPGMSGPALAERMGELVPGLRVVFMTGYTDEAIADRGLEQLTFAILQKPFHRDQLLTKIADTLDQPERSPP